MRTQRQPEHARVSKEFVETFGLTPSGVSKQTGIPLAELGKIIGEVARNMHSSPHSVLNQVRYFGMSESFLMNLAVKYNRRGIQKSAVNRRNKIV